MPRQIAVKESAPIQLSPKQIFDIYLEAQTKIGLLLAGSPPEHIQELKQASQLLLRVKRQWIGYQGELE